MAIDLFPFSIQVTLGQTETDDISQKLDATVQLYQELQPDDNAAQISIEEYHPYGATTVFDPTKRVEDSFQTIRYSGRTLDDVGLHYFGYRYYQPWAGRWLTADPQGATDQMNLFQAVNNPANK
ncbi:RHS repeat-associated core domain-containing protein [Hahella sp. NBU794]|uniref:RHS repeat-associated core domain-containing protein n=1 Tax=Hahella sp. NBU794 TaxID=3422590 RepID=UPI003D6E0AF7